MNRTKEFSPNLKTVREGVVEEVATPRQHALVGTMLDGRYLIKSLLGYGGFGEVYVATDEKMVSRTVVVKVMRDDSTENQYSVKKFRQEIEALARIDHPSIVGIFDAGE